MPPNNLLSPPLVDGSARQGAHDMNQTALPPSAAAMPSFPPLLSSRLNDKNDSDTSHIYRGGVEGQRSGEDIYSPKSNANAGGGRPMPGRPSDECEGIYDDIQHLHGQPMPRRPPPSTLEFDLDEGINNPRRLHEQPPRWPSTLELDLGEGAEYSIPNLHGQPMSTLELALGEGTDDDNIPNLLPSSATYRDDDRFRISAPSLRIRPLPSKKGDVKMPDLSTMPALSKSDKVKMPSPLQRRGAAERAYLQRQLKAEALRRRRQEQHNEQRKLDRESAGTAPIEGDLKHNKSDGDLTSLIEKFELIGGNLGGPPKLPEREFGASPPAILKKTFKRSVSSVLDDSGIDEECNLLFFPDGGDEVPLLLRNDDGLPSRSRGGIPRRMTELDTDEEDEDDEDANGTSNDLESRLSVSDNDRSLGESIPLRRNSSVPNFSVTLRPKTSPPNSGETSSNGDCISLVGKRIPALQFKPVIRCKSTSDFQSTSLTPAEASIPDQDSLISDGDNVPSNLARALDNAAAIESSQQLSFGDEGGAKNRDRADSDRSCFTHEGSVVDQYKHFVFSSPEAAFNRSMSFGKASADAETTNDFEASLPDDSFNYRTPESEHRWPRKHLAVRMPKLPELSMPDISISESTTQFDGQASYVIGATFDEENEAVEDNLPASYEKVTSCALLESTYRTPVNSFNIPLSSLDMEMPKLPVLGKSSQKESQVPNYFTVEKGIEVSAEVLPESDFRTPDNSFHSSSRKRLGRKMPSLTELCMPYAQSGQNEDQFQLEKLCLTPQALLYQKEQACTSPYLDGRQEP